MSLALVLDDCVGRLRGAARDVEQAMAAFWRSLSEKDKRRYAAAEAMKFEKARWLRSLWTERGNYPENWRWQGWELDKGRGYSLCFG